LIQEGFVKAYIKEGSMKVLIIGAGVVGSIFGWALTRGGHEVTHLVRPGRAVQFANGMPVDVIDRRPHHPEHVQEIYPICARESISPAERFDLVIIPTKHYTLEQTLQQIAPFTRGTDTLLLTQNWQGTQQIDQWLDPAKYSFGDAKAGGSFLDERLVCTIKAIDIGSRSGKTDDCLQKCISLFQSAQITTHVQDDMLYYLWVQYAYTAGPWPMLVRAGSFKKLYSDRQSSKLILAAIQESLQVVRARGVDLERFPDLQMYLHPSKLTGLLVSIALSWMFAHDEYRKRCSLHALADPQEVRTFYFDVLNSGHELHVPMPVLDSFREDMLAFTQPGSAW
jgi:2-dehydropantoate 2-reductase